MSDELNKIEEDTPVEKQGSDFDKRRKFIKKASTGALITTLPAKSVWGACTVSGALSSGSQQTDICSVPSLSGGRSPGYWKGEGNGQGNGQGNSQGSGGGSSNGGGNYHGAFTQYGNGDNECLKAEIILFQQRTIVYPNPKDTSVSFSLFEGLGSNGTGDGNIWFHLSAAYLNAYYGFYGDAPYGIFPEGSTILDTRVSSAEDLVHYLYASMLINTDVAILASIEASYDEGTTDYNQFLCP